LILLLGLPRALLGLLGPRLGFARRDLRFVGPLLGLAARLVRGGVGLGELGLGGGHPPARVLDVAAGAVALLLRHPATLEPDESQRLARLRVVGGQPHHLLVGAPRLGREPLLGGPASERAPPLDVLRLKRLRAIVVLVERRSPL